MDIDWLTDWERIILTLVLTAELFVSIFHSFKAGIAKSRNFQLQVQMNEK